MVLATSLRNAGGLLLLLLLALLGIGVQIFYGSVSLPFEEVIKILSFQGSEDAITEMILREVRFPRILTALCAGAALGCSGLLMQTFFRNPLAGPYELGISSGASLGVALTLLLGAGELMSSDWGLVLPASLGALLSMSLVLLMSRRVSQPAALLILGLMLGYLTSGFVGMILSLSDASTLKNFLLWSFGTFGGVAQERLPILIGFSILPAIPAYLLARSLNLMLLGEEQARTMGVNPKRLSLVLILLSSLQAAVVTAFCGPVAFLGLAAPHATRMLFKTADHRLLIPATMLLGASLALWADWLSLCVSSTGVLPLNAITSILGAPFVVFILLKDKDGGIA